MTSNIKPFQYKRFPSIKRRPLNRLFRGGGETRKAGGVVQGKKASEDELRFSKGLDRAGIPYEFSVKVNSNYSVLGQENQVDFILHLPWKVQPVEVDGEFAHKTIGQKEKDRQRDLLLNDTFKKDGIEPVIRLDTLTYLKDDRVTDKTIREMFL